MEDILDLLEPCQIHNSENCLLFCYELELSGPCIDCGKRFCQECWCRCGMPRGWTSGDLTDEQIDAAQEF